ncbi:trace amine-associated receptor 1-like [Mugil cephalus]|uniref:trace amine-associated receptor 1-like n=1 Tax=Mugil cephalus TaxID=48193 RepID=UPI001FB6760A|nr:trace amine-associated receptor 1-like [Mugil cephalus]
MQFVTGVNKTEFFNLNPCYKIDASYVLTQPSTICIIFHIFLGLLSVVTVCGNLLVITSIIYFKQLHTSTNALILSLAVADLLVGAVVFPLSMVFSMSLCLFKEEVLCKVRASFDITLSTCSILNLCCISIDRYYAVCQPLTYRAKMSGRIVVTMILVSWGVPAAIATSSVIRGSNQGTCKEQCFSDAVGKTMGVVFTFYLPLILLLCIYLKIFLVAQRQARSIQNTTKSGATVSKMERKATKTLAIVMGVFLTCWLPFFLCVSVVSLSNASEPGPLQEILNWLALSNSMVNPFIYAFFYSWFRSAFRMIISGKIIFGDFSNCKLI